MKSSLHEFPALQAPLHQTVDVEKLAKSITGWEQVYDQTSPGRFRGHLTELLLGPAQLFAESSSHALVQHCRTWRDAIWFGIPGQAAKPGRVEGTPIEHGMLAVRSGREEFQLTTPDNFVFFGVVVRLQALQEYLEREGGGTLPQRALDQRVMQVADPALQAFTHWLCTVLCRCSRTAFADLPAQTKLALVDEALSGLAQLLTSRQGEPRDAVSAQHARRLVRRVREYLHANDDRSVTVHELCTQLGTSRRALQDCFRRSMDLTPKTYLRAFGLNAVRRELQRPGCTGVGDVATRHGFWHLSQFATDYKRLFGELPSETLRGRAG